ncbi:MAG: sigma factor, partial [Victivallaceae bacterium]|nr:sigma factor [Victivallaceae bacterium]
PPCVFCRRPRRSPLLEANTKMTKNNYAGINPMVVRIAKSAARKTIGRYGFTESDLPDLEQELVTAGLKMMARFDPGKSKETTFIARVVESKILDLIVRRQAECRDWRKCRQSLNETVIISDVGAVELIDLICTDDNKNFALVVDVDIIRGRLPAELQELCEYLINCAPGEIPEAAMQSRGAFQYRMKKLRENFQKHGF